MAKRKTAHPLTPAQRDFMNSLPQEGWAPIPYWMGNSGIRGLISRGLIEHRWSNAGHPTEWITQGEVRRVTTKRVYEEAPMGDDT